MQTSCGDPHPGFSSTGLGLPWAGDRTYRPTGTGRGRRPAGEPEGKGGLGRPGSLPPSGRPAAAPAEQQSGNNTAACRPGWAAGWGSPPGAGSQLSGTAVCGEPKAEGEGMRGKERHGGTHTHREERPRGSEPGWGTGRGKRETKRSGRTHGPVSIPPPNLARGSLGRPSAELDKADLRMGAKA